MSRPSAVSTTPTDGCATDPARDPSRWWPIGQRDTSRAVHGACGAGVPVSGYELREPDRLPDLAAGSELAHVGLEVEHRHPVDGLKGLHCDRQVADLQQTADRNPEPVGTALGVLRPWATPSCHADAELRSARPRGAGWSDALGGGPASSN